MKREMARNRIWTQSIILSFSCKSVHHYPLYSSANRIAHVNDYPTVNYFGIPSLTKSMIAYKILTEYFGNSNEKLHCGNFVNMAY